VITTVVVAIHSRMAIDPAQPNPFQHIASPFDYVLVLSLPCRVDLEL